MGGILIKQWKGTADRRIQINLGAKVVGELAHLQHCIFHKERMGFVQTYYREFRSNKNFL